MFGCAKIKNIFAHSKNLQRNQNIKKKDNVFILWKKHQLSINVLSVIIVKRCICTITMCYSINNLKYASINDVQNVFFNSMISSASKKFCLRDKISKITAFVWSIKSNLGTGLKFFFFLPLFKVLN